MYLLLLRRCSKTLGCVSGVCLSLSGQTRVLYLVAVSSLALDLPTPCAHKLDKINHLACCAWERTNKHVRPSLQGSVWKARWAASHLLLLPLSRATTFRIQAKETLCASLCGFQTSGCPASQYLGSRVAPVSLILTHSRHGALHADYVRRCAKSAKAEGSIGLSPIYPRMTNDLHIGTSTSLHQSCA